jgi:hypothetical protein
MTAEIVIALLGAVAAGALGLWWGERGRRRAAERWAVRGSPDDEAPAATSRVPVREAEDRFLEATEATRKEIVERGMEEARAELKAQGIPVDETRLRKEIERMVDGEDVLE